MKTIKEMKKGIKDFVAAVVEQAFGIQLTELSLNYPPNVELGDFAIECFPLAKQLRKSPNQIAKDLAKAFSGQALIVEAKATGPYLNLKLSNQALFETACVEAISSGADFGKSELAADRIMVEYLSPNTNKPLHLGHMRNGCLGMAVSNILDATGSEVVKASLINDRGVHICKSMLAWQRWGQGATPESTGVKGDHFVGKWYVKYSQEAEKDVHLDEEVLEMLKRWEAGDEEILECWRMMNDWVYQGFGLTYDRLGLAFDKIFYESETYKLGKDIIAAGVGKSVFLKDAQGNTVFNLPVSEFGLDKDGQAKKITVLRPDGTSLYITQDIGTALMKVTIYNLDRSIYVVGSEQIHHFKSLFKMLGSLGYEWAKGCYHLAYGMVYLPEGKMKSREGKVVDADNLMDEMSELAMEEIKKRNHGGTLTEEEIRERGEKIGIGAIKFFLLRVRPQQDIYFDPVESISFDGFTGPYCQYTYARISGIMRNAPSIYQAATADFSLLGNLEELQLVQKLIQFEDELAGAAREYNPSRLAIHVFETAKAFNQFYSRHQVLHNDSRGLTEARLALVEATGVVIKRGLNLLGIEALEKM
ncbi:MAG: arginine--tRNA ligase [Candidatus Falkowbacteria bacterium]